MTITDYQTPYDECQESSGNSNTATASADDLAHRVLPYLCSCGYHLVGFTQAWATHTTTYAHCVNNACSNYYNTQELSYYMDTAS